MELFIVKTSLNISNTISMVYLMNDYLSKKTYLPSQVVPSTFNSYPVLQVHVKDPGVFVQPPFVSSHPSVLAVHSSISKFLNRYNICHSFFLACAN